MKLAGDIETVILIAKPEYSFLSSSVVKEIAANGGDISRLVPDCICDTVASKYR